MSRTLINYSIFIASPRGLEQERETFKLTIDEFNTFDANPMGVHFTPIGWEITLGGIGRPQASINLEIEKCDYFIILLHDRWGTPPDNKNSQYTSGTEEEFYIANKCYYDPNRPLLDIVPFFKAVNERQLNDPGSELKKVLDFRMKIENEKNFLYETFDVPEKFKDKLRRYLAKWTRDSGNKQLHYKHTSPPSPTINNYTLDNKINLSSKEDTESLLQEAEKFAKEGKILEAELRFSQLTVRTEDPNIMIRYARFLRRIGQLKRSLELSKKALDKAKIIGDFINQAYAFRQIGRVEDVCAHYDEAQLNYQNAINLYIQQKDNQGEARTLIDLGKILKKKGEYQSAIEVIEKSLLIYEKKEDKNGLANALGSLGLIYKTKGNIDKAEEYQKKSLKIHEELNNILAQAITLSNLAVIYRIKNRLLEALELHKRSLDIFNRTKDKKGIAREYSNLGVIYRLLKDNNKAKEMHNEALNLSEQIGDQDGIAIQYGNLGMIAKLEGDQQIAEIYYKKSLELSIKIGNKVGQSIQYKNLSILFRENKEYEKSIINIQNALDIDNKSNNEYGIAVGNLELSNTYLDMGMIDNAMLFAETSMFYFNKLNMTDKMEYAREIVNKINKNKNNPS